MPLRVRGPPTPNARLSCSLVMQIETPSTVRARQSLVLVVSFCLDEHVVATVASTNMCYYAVVRVAASRIPVFVVIGPRR